MRVLVTGGGGFLGRAVCAELARAGHRVRSASRARHAELDTLDVEQVAMDLRSPDEVERAAAGQDAIVHCAALAGIWGPRRAYWDTNVDGTRHVIAAARARGIARLVHTSSPSACFDGRPHVRLAAAPLAERFLAHYPASKAAAERLVLAANGPELATAVLRPHLIVGPGDPHILPRLVARARAGRLVVVGDGANEVSLTDVENAALAHRLAVEQLEPGAGVTGRAYFVAQREPVRLWPWLGELLERLGCPRPRRRLPLPAAYALGAICEALWRAGALRGEPPMTRFLALQLGLSHSYDVGPLERDFGYRERRGVAETTERIAAAAWSAHTT
jgi:nucleoside-diphosphate-sugar epimerase